MKIILGFKICGFLLAAAFFAGLGFGTNASDQERSYLIDLNSKTAIELGTLGGIESYPIESYPLVAINDAGQVVGESETTGGEIHAFITGPNGVSMADLSTLGEGSSSAKAINNAGQVVGESNSHAFVTGLNRVDISDLNSLVNSPSGVVLTSATGINNLGQVIAVGLISERASYALLFWPALLSSDSWRDPI